MSNRNPLAARAYFFFTVFMIVLYVAIGLMLIFVLKFLEIQSVNRIAGGSVLIVYAGYRLYKLIREKKYISSTNQENESA
jgi:hypothetical protein